MFYTYRPALARKLVAADRDSGAAYFVLGDGQSQWLAFRKKTKKHTNQKTPEFGRFVS